jgi:UDP:flavonoid glycosyltransferase YjiC (YdhE family)
MSRIRLIAADSRGDLQPYLAILLELQHRGHQVTLIGSVNFQAVAEAHSVQFVPLPGDLTTLLNLDALLGELLETAHAAIEGTDLLLVSPL